MAATFAVKVKLGVGATVSVSGAVCVMPPPVPFTLMVYVPGVAFDATLKVAVRVPSPGAARVDFDKDAVTPVGNPVMLTATVDLKDPRCKLLRLTWPEAPVFMVNDVVEAVSMKVLGTTTVMGMARVRVKPLPAAVSERLCVPPAALNTLLIVSVVDAPTARVPEAVVADTPAGAPATVNVKGALNDPWTSAQESWAVAVCPAVTVTLPGFAASVQTGGARIVSATEAIFVMPPPLAVTVNG